MAVSRQFNAAGVKFNRIPSSYPVSPIPSFSNPVPAIPRFVPSSETDGEATHIISRFEIAHHRAVSEHAYHGTISTVSEGYRQVHYLIYLGLIGVLLGVLAFSKSTQSDHVSDFLTDRIRNFATVISQP
ncbi:hypothetical protein LCGC14_1291090 [marine sediment metagenome]|uniref:Uncharacterized protein n=1 Tax=marine sediment metagenome TaxID=412755 RepID=A0A0F9KSG9_9ZZZZ